MTREEFTPQFQRLCTGHRFDPTEKQIEAYFEELNHGEADDFRRAVTRLLAARQFPANVGMIQAEMSRASDERRRVEALKAREAGGGIFSETKVDVVSEAMEEIYRAARMKIVLQQIGASEEKKVEAALTGLDQLINDPFVSEWLASAKMGVCRIHPGDHSTLECITDERAYWEIRSEGVKSVEAWRRLAAKSVVPINPDLLVLTNEYGRAKADQSGRLL
jgi:hypothetical protein